MNADVAKFIPQIPGWAEADDLEIKPIAGLTNSNYLVTVNNERYVLRVSGSNSALLGINRYHELEALETASAIGIGPEIVHFILPQGHLVTRFIDGRHWRFEEYCNPENLSKIVDVVKHIHSLPAVEGIFSPFQRVETYASQAKEFQVPFPGNFAVFLEMMSAIKDKQVQDEHPWLKFCHNDLYYVNILDDGALRIIDWEFAGMGDIYFDLATLIYAYDTHGPLSPDLENYILECYFGQIDNNHRQRLAGAKFMLLFFTAMWGMLQHGLILKGLIPPVEGFDYLEYAQYTFGMMREMI